MIVSHVIKDNNPSVLIQKNSDSNIMTMKDEVIFYFSVFTTLKEF